MKGTPLLHHSDEKTLLKQVQQGKTQAFNLLVEKYQSRLYHHILGNIRNPETAKDLCQETWIKAFRAINTFRGDSVFSSWLYRIAENVCIDFLRRQKAFYDIDSLHVIDERCIIGTHPDPYELLQKQELRQILHDAIAQLTLPRKRVFLLYYVENLSVKEIAKQTERSEGTIKSHLRNARLQLQELLTPYLKNEDNLHLSSHFREHQKS